MGRRREKRRDDGGSRSRLTLLTLCICFRQGFARNPSSYPDRWARRAGARWTVHVQARRAAAVQPVCVSCVLGAVVVLPLLLLGGASRRSRKRPSTALERLFGALVDGGVVGLGCRGSRLVGPNGGKTETATKATKRRPGREREKKKTGGWGVVCDEATRKTWMLGVSSAKRSEETTEPKWNRKKEEKRRGVGGTAACMYIRVHPKHSLKRCVR